MNVLLNISNKSPDPHLVKHIKKYILLGSLAKKPIVGLFPLLVMTNRQVSGTHSLIGCFLSTNKWLTNRMNQKKSLCNFSIGLWNNVPHCENIFEISLLISRCFRPVLKRKDTLTLSLVKGPFSNHFLKSDCLTRRPNINKPVPMSSPSLTRANQGHMSSHFVSFVKL